MNLRKVRGRDIGLVSLSQRRHPSPVSFEIFGISAVEHQQDMVRKFCLQTRAILCDW
jgi:hypothetical protein